MNKKKILCMGVGSVLIASSLIGCAFSKPKNASDLMKKVQISMLKDPNFTMDVKLDGSINVSGDYYADDNNSDYYIHYSVSGDLDSDNTIDVNGTQTYIDGIENLGYSYSLSLSDAAFSAYADSVEDITGESQTYEGSDSLADLKVSGYAGYDDGYIYSYLSWDGGETYTRSKELFSEDELNSITNTLKDTSIYDGADFAKTDDGYLVTVDAEDIIRSEYFIENYDSAVKSYAQNNDIDSYEEYLYENVDWDTVIDSLKDINVLIYVNDDYKITKISVIGLSGDLSSETELMQEFIDSLGLSFKNVSVSYVATLDIEFSNYDCVTDEAVSVPDDVAVESLIAE